VAAAGAREANCDEIADSDADSRAAEAGVSQTQVESELRALQPRIQALRIDPEGHRGKLGKITANQHRTSIRRAADSKYSFG